MTLSKKYDYRTTEQKDSWSAEVVRRASSKKFIVSKKQNGFKTEADAKQWAAKELVQFTAKQSAQNKRRAEKRK